MSIVITGATGQLGKQVINFLIQKGKPAASIVAVVRNPDRAEDLKALGVTIVRGDYEDVASLEAAFTGATSVLLVSGNDIDRRIIHHTNAVTAAKNAHVPLLVYTSLLHATTSPLTIAADHVATEQLIQDNQLPFVFLRNGWYSENFLGGAGAALQYGAFVGAAGEGRFSSTSRTDYAEAAAVVLAAAGDEHVGKIYELAGDESHTLGDVAAVISEIAGRQIPYVNLPEAEYKQVLLSAGLPSTLSGLLADADVKTQQGGLLDDSGDLRRLLGRPTTSFRTVLTNNLAAAH